MNIQFYSHFDYNLISRVMESLMLIERLPGCEKGVEELKAVLEQEFAKVPEKNGIKKFRTTEYYPNGLCITDNSKMIYKTIISPWTSSTVTKDKGHSFNEVKLVNPIWFYQVRQQLGQRYTVNKDHKFNYQDIKEKIEQLKDLPDSEELEEIKETLLRKKKDMEYKIHVLFLKSTYSSIRDRQSSFSFSVLTEDDIKGIVALYDKQTNKLTGNDRWNIRHELWELERQKDLNPTITFYEGIHFKYVETSRDIQTYNYKTQKMEPGVETKVDISYDYDMIYDEIQERLAEAEDENAIKVFKKMELIK